MVVTRMLLSFLILLTLCTIPVTSKTTRSEIIEDKMIDAIDAVLPSGGNCSMRLCELFGDAAWDEAIIFEPPYERNNAMLGIENLEGQNGIAFYYEGKQIEICYSSYNYNTSLPARLTFGVYYNENNESSDHLVHLYPSSYVQVRKTYYTSRKAAYWIYYLTAY